MKKISNCILLFWLLGGGFIISLGCLVVSWKIALGVFCVWCCSWIVTLIYWSFQAKIIYFIEKDKKEKAQKLQNAIDKGIKEGQEDARHCSRN